MRLASVRERAAGPRTKRWVFLSVCLLAFTALPAHATVLQSGNLRLTLLSQVQPHLLPRTEKAPIAVFLSGHVAAVDRGVPPQLRGLTIDLNRHGSLNSAGLPVCDIARIQPSTTERAISACGPALVGSGQFWAHIVLPGQDPYPTHGRLLVFNGARGCTGSDARPTFPFPTTGWGGPSRPRTQGAKRALHVSDRGRGDAPCHPQPVILAHIFTANPFATSFVIPFAIRHIGCADGGRQTKLGKDAGSEGRGAHTGVRDLTRATEDTAPRCVRRSPYGLRLTADLPKALGTWGYVDRIKLTLRRKYQVGGEQRSYFNANCPAQPGTRSAVFQLAQADFSFGGKKVSVSVPKSCGVKGP